METRGSKRNFLGEGNNYNNYQPRKKARRIFNVDTEENDENNTKDESIYSLGISEETVKCRVGGIEIEMLIDSGSNYNIIDECTWDLMNIKGVKFRNGRTKCPYRFLAYGRTPLVVKTVFDAMIKIKDGETILSCEDTFYVIEKGQQSLLGRSTATKLGVLFVGLPSSWDRKLNKLEDSEMREFPKIKGVKIQLPINRSVRPVKQPLRRCPIALLPKVKDTLEDLLKSGIIEKVDSPCSWISPLVPTLKDNGRPLRAR